MKNSLQNKLHTLYKHTEDLNKVYKPVFYRLSVPVENKHFEELLKTPGLVVSDCLMGQLKELMKIRHPSEKLDSEQQEKKALLHLGNIEAAFYGVWVYYPWSNRLVHIVDEQEFIELRTCRNQYKITREEQDLLSQKKIGVIGLSVGQSVSLTLAMERIAGEIRLVDFDILELTNLNRIRTGIHNLGLHKVYIVAREIAEIDPFIKVKCFPEGLSETNMDAFFTEEGKLDLLVEESDGFDIKILSRYKAKSLGIPVIMEANDRCMIDVERFDLDPGRPILHGLVKRLDVEQLKQLKTNEEKIPYMLDVLGIDTASALLKASMLEIEQSITTWPQLATSTTMGGAVCADTIRRIFLDQYSGSGRFHLDLEQLINDPPSLHLEPTKTILSPTNNLSLSREEMLIIASEYGKHSNQKQGLDLSVEQLEQLINAAILAPSGGNTQPWQWVYHNRALYLFHDVKRSYSLLDFDCLASYIALGTAIENLTLKAHELKIEICTTLFPVEQEKRLIGVFNFQMQPSMRTELHVVDHLASGIAIRTTNRMLSQREPLSIKQLDILRDAAATQPGSRLHFFDSEDTLEEFADIIAKIERIRIMHPRGHFDFNNEIRWTPEENERTKDGIDIATLELTESEKAGLIVARDWNVISLLKKWKKGKAFERLSRNAIASASCIGLITMPRYTPVDYINGGRALQRVWLAANLEGIAFQPQSPATFFFARLIQGHGQELDEDTQKEIQTLYTRFKQLTGISSDETEVFLFRLSHAKEPKVKSLRRPLEDVLIIN